MDNKKRHRRNIVMLTTLTILTFIIALAGYMWPQSRADQGRFYLSSTAGAVLFDHDGHQDLVSECSTCHHELTTGDGEADTCRGCHLAHPSEGETVVECSECHDDPDYVPGVLDHEDLVDIEDHDCDGCHTPRATADAYHAACNACHLEEAPARFSDAGGQPLCTGCHLK